MPTRQQREQEEDSEQRECEILNALIEEEVFCRLGEPDGLHRVQVRRLWQDHYRVNVFVGENAVTAKIASSYFVEADSDGNIVGSNPKITAVRPVH